MSTYEIALLGQDPLALTLVQRLAHDFARIVWVVEDRQNLPALPVEVEILEGNARFLDDQTFLCETSNGSHTIHANQIIIATGATPRMPGWVIEHPRVLTAHQVDQLPPGLNNVAVVGVGTEGVEICQKLQGRVKTLQCLDANSIHWDRQNLLLNGATSCWLSPNNAVIGLEASGETLTLYLEDGQSLQTDAVLVCCGHHGNTESLNLQAAGLTPDDRGRIWCNESYETWTTGIFAVGSVVGFPRDEKPALAQIHILSEALSMHVTAQSLSIT